MNVCSFLLEPVFPLVRTSTRRASSRRWVALWGPLAHRGESHPFLVRPLAFLCRRAGLEEPEVPRPPVLSSPPPPLLSPFVRCLGAAGAAAEEAAVAPTGAEAARHEAA